MTETDDTKKAKITLPDGKYLYANTDQLNNIKIDELFNEKDRSIEIY